MPLARMMPPNGCLHHLSWDHFGTGWRLTLEGNIFTLPNHSHTLVIFDSPLQNASVRFPRTIFVVVR